MARRLFKTADRGYGAAHQRERERHRPAVEAGRARCCEIICLFPSRLIPPAAKWDLAHNRRTGAHLGPAHRKCNQAEGWRWANHLRQLRALGIQVQPISQPKQPDEGNRWGL